MKKILCRIILFFVAFLLSGNMANGQADFSVSGRVIDSETREPLAFVNILISGTRVGVSTDIDGKFTIYSRQSVESIMLTYVGYHPMTYVIPSGKTSELVISLQKKTFNLKEVVILPTINPAHRIIDSVMANRHRNDPEKLKTFSYTSYEKTIFTAQLDTIIEVEKDSAGTWAVDTLDNQTVIPEEMVGDTTVSDSVMNELKKFFSRQDIAIMETVVERKFMAPDRNYENVKANRISGFQDPIFVFLVSQIQSTSFYREIFNIFDKAYINPISRGSKTNTSSSWKTPFIPKPKTRSLSSHTGPGPTPISTGWKGCCILTPTSGRSRTP
ncbi:MAG: carboxypeptidase-like regulatory domain-containing protein [Bacteroidales bacterium]